MESTSSRKHRRINALASEVARHQQVTETADFKFNSRRLHHSTHLTLRLRRTVRFARGKPPLGRVP